MSSTPTELTPPGARDGNRNVKRAAMSGWIGSALEYYDFALYSTAAALVFPTIFFTSDNPTVALIASLVTYAVGYVMRPVGAVVLGAWGDRHGRKNVLVLAMLMMGFSTMAVGLLPTYQQVGVWAPAALIVLRLIQGFAVAGELGGSNAMIVEHAPDGRRGFFASFSLQGTQAGSILATAAMLPLASLLPQAAWMGWGWRVPFLLSAVVIIAGYVIRSRVVEPPAFEAQQAAAEKAHEKRKFPFVELITKHPWVTLLCIVMTFTNVNGMATMVFGVSFATQKGYGVGFTSSDMLWVTLFANIVAVITIPIWGMLSDKFGRKIFMIVGGIGGGIGAGFYLMAVQAKAYVLMFVIIFFVQGIFFHMWNATFATFYQEQFPMRIRVTGFAISQNVGLMIASFFPSIFAAIAPPGSTTVPMTIGIATLVISLLAVGATALVPETKGKSLAELENAGSTTPEPAAVEA